MLLRAAPCMHVRSLSPSMHACTCMHGHCLPSIIPLPPLAHTAWRRRCHAAHDAAAEEHGQLTRPPSLPFSRLPPSILVCGGGGVALHTTRRLKNMGSWVWQLQRTDVRRPEIEKMMAIVAKGDAMCKEDLQKVFDSEWSGGRGRCWMVGADFMVGGTERGCTQQALHAQCFGR